MKHAVENTSAIDGSVVICPDVSGCTSVAKCDPSNWAPNHRRVVGVCARGGALFV